MIKSYKSLYLDISTFDNLSLKGENLKDTFSYVVENWLSKFDCPLLIITEKNNGQKKTFKFSDKNLEINYDSMKKGDLHHILVAEDSDASGGNMKITSAISLGVSCSYQDEWKQFIKYRICDNITFSISEIILPHPITIEWQEKWVELFKELFYRINGVNGFISIGYPTAAIIPNTTGFESKLGLYYPELSKNYDICTRGLFWGTIFTQRHIELLGGIEKIKETGLFYKVEELSLDSGQAVYLQLTEDIHTVTPEHLEKLEAFYAPILPNADDLMDWINKEV